MENTNTTSKDNYSKKQNDGLNLPFDYNIKSSKVRVIMQDGSTSIMSRDDAIQKAKSEGKNLVQISFNKNVYPGSICKIIDYSKFKYEQKKKAKENARKARASKIETKEISFSIRIDVNDKNRNIEHIKQFILDGNKVIVSIMLSRREMDHVQLAHQMMAEIVEATSDVAEIDSPKSMNGRKMTCILRKKSQN